MASLAINIANRFAAAKQDYLDLVRVPEIRGKVPGLHGQTAGNLNGTAYRLYNWKPIPEEKGEKAVEFSTYKAKPWSVLVRFWKPTENGGWEAISAPSSFDDDDYMDDDTVVYVTASDVTEGNIPRWLLLAPEALDASIALLPGWEEPRRFKAMAEMEEKLFEEIDALLTPSTTEGSRAYLEARIDEADDVSSLKGRVLAFFQETLSRAEAETNTIVEMLLDNAKIAFDEAFPIEGIGINALEIYFPDEEEFEAAIEAGADGFQSALFGEKGMFFSYKTKKKVVRKKTIGGIRTRKFSRKKLEEVQTSLFTEVKAKVLYKSTKLFYRVAKALPKGLRGTIVTA